MIPGISYRSNAKMNIGIIIRCFLYFVAIPGTIHSASSQSKPPHIVFFFADDLGWNDIGFNNAVVHSPNIDRFAREGVILDQSYVHPLCTPSRAALMSGRYPHRLGLQHLAIWRQAPSCLPLNETLLPERLRRLGYKTHMIGKWHLGFCKWECTPTYRGFDSFYGYYNAAQGYYNHSSGCLGEPPCDALDFRDGRHVVRDMDGIYSTNAYSLRADDLISAHDPDEPMFLYIAAQSVQSYYLEVPSKYEDLYPQVENSTRKTYLGMVSAMDDMFGRVVDSLEDNGMLEDTLIVFQGDNGGDVTGGAGNNYPLRGCIQTVFEGGTRTPGFVWGKGLQHTGYRYQGLVHVTDWVPTFVRLAGGEVVDELDGVDQWDAISTNSPGARTELVYHIDESADPLQGESAIRVGDWKLIRGFPGYNRDWHCPPEDEDTECPHEASPGSRLAGSEDKEMWLFNLRDDPSEVMNLVEDFPDVARELERKLDGYYADLVPANYPPIDPASHPDNFGGVWSPGWC